MKGPIQIKFRLSFLPTLQYSSTPKELAPVPVKPSNADVALGTRFSMLKKWDSWVEYQPNDCYIPRSLFQTDKSTMQGGKMRKRDVKRLSLSLTILMVSVFALMAPSLATAGLYTDTGLDLQIPKNKELELHFSTLHEDSDLMYSDEASYNSYDEQLGYWFEDIPWLGIASEAPLLQKDEKEEDISIGADTNFDPLSGFLLLRYPKWRLQPFVGIGPTFFVSDLTNDTVDSFRHIFMGIYYNF